MTSAPETAGTSAADCLRLLQARGETVATAESLTCGLISATLASVPGASAALLGGVATYTTEVKANVLHIPRRILAENGAVSGPCAEAMAESVRDLFGATWGVSATGVAGPERQEGKQVGTVFVAVAGPGSARVRRLDIDSARVRPLDVPGSARVRQFDLPGEREAVRLGSVNAALNLLLAAVREQALGDPAELRR